MWGYGCMAGSICINASRSLPKCRQLSWRIEKGLRPHGRSPFHAQQRARIGSYQPQMRSGNQTTKLSRFGIFTFGKVVAFISSFSPISLLAANR
jgi:hypothetical protein